ncbi:MAG: hypothetical protein ACLQDY_26950 [Streptosporangiaceae bacterium]
MPVDWSTISSLATGGGTLVLAVATFAAVRSSNRSARIAEEALLVGMRPLLVPSRLDDVKQKVFFGDGQAVRVDGGMAAVFAAEESRGAGPAATSALGDGSAVIYLAISLRNAGAGIAVLRSWNVEPEVVSGQMARPPDLSEQRQHSRDIYIPPNDIGFWQGAIRAADDGRREATLTSIKNGQPLAIDIEYSDHEGGQRAVSRFVLRPHDGEQGQLWLASVVRHWNLDRPDPRTLDRPGPS